MRTLISTTISLVAFVFAVAVILGLQRMGVDSDLTLALVGVALSIALVAATVGLVDESRKLREAQSAPYVSVTIRPWVVDVNITEFCIENHGRGSAREIKFELHGDFKLIDDGKLSGLRVIRHGLRYLEPGGKYVTIIGGANFLHDNLSGDADEDVAIRVTSTYVSASGNSYRNESWLEGRERIGATPPLKGIEGALKDLRNSIRTIEHRLGPVDKQ